MYRSLTGNGPYLKISHEHYAPTQGPVEFFFVFLLIALSADLGRAMHLHRIFGGVFLRESLSEPWRYLPIRRGFCLIMFVEAEESTAAGTGAEKPHFEL